MNLFLQYWRVFAAFGLLASVFTLGFTVGSDRVQAKWNEDQLRNSLAREQARKDNEDTITQLEKTKNENLVTIATLRRDLKQLGVLLPKTPCTGGVSKPQTPAGNTLSATGSGYVSTPAQTAFDRFTVGLGENAEMNSKIIENCRTVMEWAKAR